MLEIEPKCCNDAGTIATFWFVFEHDAGMQVFFAGMMLEFSLGGLLAMKVMKLHYVVTDYE